MTTTIAYIGRLDPQKGVDTLLDALAQLEASHDYRVDIVGDDILENGMGLAGYRQLATQLGVADRVTFHGWVEYDRLTDYYARADIFVHPGRWPEPFGRTLLEALQHDCAVVCSDVGAPPWVADSAALTFERDDMYGLRDCLARLLENPDERRTLQRNAREERSRFEPSTVTEQVLATYEAVL